MDEGTYRNNVLARCSQEWHYRLIDREDLKEILQELITWGNRLDQVKKALFYGTAPTEREYFIKPDTHLNGGTEYKTRNLIHAIIGAATETTEMLECLLAKIENGAEFDETNLQEEFGDLNWYRTLALIMLSQDNGQNMWQNDRKLEKRYGPAFSAKRANNRDLDAERTSLEG